RIGRAMQSRITAHDRERLFSRKPVFRDRSGEGGEQSGQSGWYIISDIVQLCGKTTKVTIAIIQMADHGISGIDQLVGKQTGQTTDQKPERRRNDAIRSVLGKTFYRCTADTAFIEMFGIAPDDHRHSPATALDTLLPQCQCDRL